MKITDPKMIEAILKRTLPSVDQHGYRVIAVGDDFLDLSLPFREEFAAPAPDGSALIYSGPIALGTADTALYACLVAAVGETAVPIFVTMSTTFYRPLDPVDLIVRARIVRLTRRLGFVEATLCSDGAADTAAQVSATYAIRHQSTGS